MRLVGDAMHRYRVPLPVVGIFPWGVVNERDALLRAQHVNEVASYPCARAAWAPNWAPCGTLDERRSAADEDEPKSCEYMYSRALPPALIRMRRCAHRPTRPSRNGAPLNPYHTHFLFVDNGRKGSAAWGSEIEFRSALETTVSRTKNIPIVQLVVQGGPGTLATIESTALAGKPIVVLVDSGGAATALHKYCTLGLEAVEPKFQSQAKRLQAIKNLNDTYGGKQLTFFSLEESVAAADGGGGDVGVGLDMSSALLEAVVKMLNQPSALERLCVGARVKHASRGRGHVAEITNVANDQRVVVAFESGESHRYGHASLHKLTVLGTEGPTELNQVASGLTSGCSTAGAEATAGQGGSTRHGDHHSVAPAAKAHTDIMLTRTLGLTVVWDRPELVRKVLAGVKAEEPGTLPEVQVAMQVVMPFPPLLSPLLSPLLPTSPPMQFSCNAARHRAAARARREALPRAARPHDGGHRHRPALHAPGPVPLPLAGKAAADAAPPHDLRAHRPRECGPHARALPEGALALLLHDLARAAAGGHA